MTPVYGKGICPECQRTISGYRLEAWREPTPERPVRIELKRHKSRITGQWCNGYRRIVTAQ